MACESRSRSFREIECQEPGGDGLIHELLQAALFGMDVTGRNGLRSVLSRGPSEVTGGAVKQAFHNACGCRQSGQDRTHERLSGKLRILDLRGAAVRATNREAQNLLARVEFFETSQGGFYLFTGDENVILGARMRVEALQ